MSEKKQFFKEEVTAYTSLFQQSCQYIEKTGKDGVIILDAADLLKNKTSITWQDQFKILLKAYG